MTKCSKCGAEMPDNEKFCMRCGNSLSTTTQATPSANQVQTTTKPKKKSRVWLWILIIALILLVVGAGILGLGYYAYKKVTNTVDEVTTKDTTTSEDNNIEITWESEDRLPTAFYTNKTEKLITFKLTSDNPVDVKLEVEIPGITEKETKNIKVKPEGTTYNCKPPFKQSAYGPLDKAQDKYITIKATNEETGELILEDSQKITILSRNDIVWIDEDGTNNMKYIAKWVTKDNKEVKELVRVAAEYNEQFCGQHAMVGYLGGPEMVYCQMASLFAAMQDYYDIAYIASTESYHTSNAQSVKLPEEVIMEKSGLCIETVVLMAAAMENLGMEPVIIFIPGHAWVAVKTSAGASTYYHLETTMLDYPVLDALDQGEMNWYQNSSSATVIDIKEAREEGIQPFGQAESGKESM